MSDLLPLKEAIYEMGLYFNQAPGDDRITAYAKALSNHTPQQVIFAFKQVINSGSAFFPSLAEILKHLRPPEEKREDLAPSIAAEIIQLLRLYGKYDEDRMRQAASQDARLVFLQLGDTSDIRNSENFETMRAQLERLARSVLSRKDAIKKAEELQKIGIVLELPKMAAPKTTFIRQQYLSYEGDDIA